MSIVDGAKEWLMRVCIKRGVKSAVIVLTSFLTAHISAKVLMDYGVNIDWATFQIKAVAGTGVALEMLHDYLKVKKGITWL